LGEFITSHGLLASWVEGLAMTGDERGYWPSYVGELWDATTKGSSKSMFAVDCRVQILGEDESWIPRWVPLYRVRGQGIYKGKGSPDRRVMSLREVLANLACKLRHLMEYA
jgi:hypothetical protein